MILKEGGNIFKDADGKPLTTRINRNDVDPTLLWLEKITGLKHTDLKLGSTGIKDTSGDLDVAVDASNVDKTDLYNKLVAWKTKNHPDDDTRAWVAKSGISVHFKTPINGNENNGFVQTDLMFGNPEFMKFAYKGTGDGTVYKGAHRAIMIASIAKAKGAKWSPGKGIVSRETNDLLASTPDDVAEWLLGPGGNPADLDSVESIVKKLKGKPDYNELTADAFDNFEKQGLPIPESRGIVAGMLQAKLRVDETRTDEFVGKALKAVGRGVAKVGKNTARQAYAGYKMGRKGSDIGAGVKAYTDAGGRKTTVGQVKDVGARIGQKITGNTVTMTGRVKDKKKPGKTLSKNIEVAKVDVAKYKKLGWKVVPDDQITIVHPSNPKIEKVISKKDFTDPAKGFEANGWTIKKEAPKDKNAITSTESVSYVTEAARIDHAEDLVYLQGSKGAMRALESLRSMANGGGGNVTLKWDGSPAVIFGRNENGEFVLTDKSGFGAKGYDGKATSGEALQNMLMGRPGAKNPDKVKRDRYIQFAEKMVSAFDTFESAVPKNFKGYFKGDLLYYQTPPVQDKNFVFKPNIVEYGIDVASELGKKIAKSTAGVVIHRMVDPDGSERPLKDLDIFEGNKLLVVPPVSIEQPASVPNEEVERLAKIIEKDAADIDKLLDQNTLRAMKVTDFPKIIYSYMNSKVDTGLDNLGKDFVKWLDTRKDISNIKKQKVIDYIKKNMNAWTSLFEVITGIMKVKDHIIADLDKNPGTVKSKTDGKEGGEGYVLAHPEGDIKLVNRAVFTAANRAVER